jgi:hypothetical protein
MHRRGRRVGLLASPSFLLSALLTVVLWLLVVPGGAHAALAWHPTHLDTHGTERFESVACPSAALCAAVDDGGQAVTFNPSSPSGATAVTIGPTSQPLLYSVACPSASQCTAVGLYGDEVTFDPASPGSPTPVQIDTPDAFLTHVACPSTTQCTAIDLGGSSDAGSQELTFNPQSPGDPQPVVVIANSDDSPAAFACPSVSQCIAVDGGGYTYSFDPASPGSPGGANVDSAGNPQSLTCPTSDECVLVDASGHEVTFEPGLPAPPPVNIDAGGAFAQRGLRVS